MQIRTLEGTVPPRSARHARRWDGGAEPRESQPTRSGSREGLALVDRCRTTVPTIDGGDQRRARQLPTRARRDRQSPVRQREEPQRAEPRSRDREWDDEKGEVVQPDDRREQEASHDAEREARLVVSSNGAEVHDEPENDYGGGYPGNRSGRGRVVERVGVRAERLAEPAHEPEVVEACCRTAGSAGSDSTVTPSAAAEAA